MHSRIRIDHALLVGGMTLGLSACALEDEVTNATDDSSSQLALAISPVYDLPLLGNDLGDLERYYTHDHAQTFEQKFGYDISTKRLTDNGSWSGVKEGVTNYSTDPHNTDALAWGRNFYAMADGVVVSCWRNAPSNPRPKKASESTDVPLAEKLWLHEEVRNRRISGAGNHLLVLQDDGRYALYAHAIPGSIPAGLCPNNATLYPAPAQDSDPVSSHCVRLVQAVTNGARITKGQKLGQIGNSGNSTGPHLHVHMSERDPSKSCSSSTAFEGVSMRFARGLSTPWNDGDADIDAWTSFSGTTIPTGEVLFWPPTKATEYARHAYPRADYGRIYSHLVNSGFKPVIFDGYTVGTDTRFNFVWRVKDRPWKAWRDMSLATFDDTIETQKSLGYEPVWAESYTTSSGVRYAAIFESGAPGSALLKANLTTAEHDAFFASAKASGYKPTTISVVSTGGELRYTDLYRTSSIGSWSLHSQVATSDYQDLFDAQVAAGRWPIYASAYMHDGTSRISVVFSSTGGPAVAGHALTSSEYQAMWAANTSAGRETRVVTGYDGAQSLHRFIGVWK